MGGQDDLMDMFELRTTMFAPFLPDEAQVNQGVYGAELAYWLAQKLAARGIMTSYPEGEDWGWYLDYASADDAEFSIHCANVDAKDDLWLLTLRRYARKMFGRDKPEWQQAAELLGALRAILNEAGIPHQELGSVRPL